MSASQLGSMHIRSLPFGYNWVSDVSDDFVLARLAAAREKYGREIHVFETSVAPSADQGSPSEYEVPDDFYEFTAEDYYRLLATKKDDKYLKTKKIRDAEEAARRSRMTKAVIRVRFPDNHTLEATFHPSETIQSLFELLNKVIAHPELPFYLYTTPPKKLIKDLSQDFYSAGFVPGAIVYFGHNVPKDGAQLTGPFIHEDVMSLKGLELMVQPDEPTPAENLESVATSNPTPAPEAKPRDKKNIKPKWLKM